MLRSDARPLTIEAYRTLLSTIESIRSNHEKFVLDHAWKPHGDFERLIQNKEVLDPEFVRLYQLQEKQRRDEEERAKHHRTAGGSAASNKSSNLPPPLPCQDQPKQFIQQQKHVDEQMQEWANKVIDAQTTHAQQPKFYRRRHPRHIPWHVIEESFSPAAMACSTPASSSEIKFYRRGSIHTPFFAHEELAVECAACNGLVASLDAIPVLFGASTGQEIMVFHKHCLPSVFQDEEDGKFF